MSVLSKSKAISWNQIFIVFIPLRALVSVNYLFFFVRYLVWKCWLYQCSLIIKMMVEKKCVMSATGKNVVCYNGKHSLTSLLSKYLLYIVVFGPQKMPPISTVSRYSCLKVLSSLDLVPHNGDTMRISFPKYVILVWVADFLTLGITFPAFL